jgi:hypothetical protein
MGAAHATSASCRDEGLFLIGIEHLSRAGIEPAHRAWLAEQGFSEAWLARFERCFELWWSRAEELQKKAPRSWLAPRVQIVAVATRPLRPFFQPIHGSSWLVYRDDFEPELASEELGVYALALAERLGWLGQIVPGYLSNLPYWLLRTEEECARFRADCERSRRPDAGALKAVAAALELVRGAHHAELRPRVLVTGGPELDLAGSGLSFAPEKRHPLESFVRRLTRELERVVQEHYGRFVARGHEPLERFLAALSEERPEVLVTGERGAILWDPEKPSETGRLQAVLRNAAPEVLDSLRADLAVTSARSRAFLASLAVPAPRPKLVMDQDGLAYLHRERNAIAYPLAGKEAHRVKEPAPPFERAMLAARTVHEWGHAAVDQGWVRVPEEHLSAHAATRGELVELLTSVWRDAPASLVLFARADVDRPPSAGETLVRALEGRMMDFQVNLLAARYLGPLELATYVRNNVRCLAREYGPAGHFHLLARYAYEAQYLRFLGPLERLDYLAKSAWLEHQFVISRAISGERLARLFDLTARWCDGYAIDPRPFVPVARMPSANTGS